MAKNTFIVAYDGEHQDVVDYAAARAVKEGAELYIVHILEWSPYSFLTPEELEERHKRRTEELAKAETMVMQPALEKARAAGATANGEIRYGSVVQQILTIAEEQGASMIFVRRAGSSTLASRVFGSVSIGLAQAAPVATVIVP